MTYEEVAEMIEEIEIPSAYYQWNIGEEPELPYSLFYYQNNADVKADNINYASKEVLILEVYSENKDFELEKKVREVLTAHDMVFSRSEQYIDSEKMYEQIYMMEVFING